MSKETPNPKQPESVLEKQERIKKLLLEAARLHAENPEKGIIFFGVAAKLTGRDSEELWHQEAQVAEIRDGVVLLAEGYEVLLADIEEVELIDDWKK